MITLVLIIICVVFVLFFYTKGIISSIQYNRKYNITPNIRSDEIFAGIVIYTFGLANIIICIWAIINYSNNYGIPVDNVVIFKD